MDKYKVWFSEFKLTEFKIVKWYSNNRDEDLDYKYFVKDLELESTAEPNDILKEFYDNFTSFYRESEKEEINMSENINEYKNILLQSKTSSSVVLLVQEKLILLKKLLKN